MKRILLATIAALAATLVVILAIPAQAELTQKDSKHRDIQDGIGNCIFSSQPLPFDKEDRYEVETSFQTGDKVYARCYYPSRIGDKKSEGKLKNSLRGMAGKVGPIPKPYYEARIQWTDEPLRNHTKVVVHKAKYDTRDQILMYLFEDRHCDFTMAKFGKPDQCVDIDRETRNMAKTNDESTPFTTQVCVSVSIDVVNETKVDPKTLGEYDVKAVHELARGCFDYTAK